VSAWSDDALFIGRAIVERLREQMPDLRSVELIDEMEDRDTEPKQTPSAVVILSSLRPNSVEPVRPAVPLEQLWLVVLVTHSKRRAGDRIATEVGPLIPACINALHGWEPPGLKHRPLGWTAGPRPDYTAKTNLYPLMFRATLVHGAS
jgi:hypothetical protein